MYSINKKEDKERSPEETTGMPALILHNDSTVVQTVAVLQVKIRNVPGPDGQRMYLHTPWCLPPTLSHFYLRN